MDSGRSIPGAAYLLVILLVVFSIFGEGFATLPNILNIGVQGSVLLLLALPMTLIIMTEGLDLSMGAVLSLAGVVLATLLMNGHGLAVALAAAAGVGLAFGVANGVLVVLLELPPFVVTLGTLGIAQGLALVLTGGQSVVGIGDALPALYESRPFGLPFSIACAAGAFLVFWFAMKRTRLGSYVSALGGNREALVLAGVHVNLVHVAIYAVGGLMSGLAALLLTGRMSAGHPTAAIGLEFDAIAAVIVGGTSFERGNGTLVGTLVGVLTIGVLKNGLNVMSVSSSLQVASIGVLVIAALVIDSALTALRRPAGSTA
ncbi:MAG TPA: ABC transporter permease [Vicinamibacterales bacterium]|nr:ABC transporter permease [Vicinamibacterales bacterium]